MKAPNLIALTASVLIAGTSVFALRSFDDRAAAMLHQLVSRGEARGARANDQSLSVHQRAGSGLGRVAPANRAWRSDPRMRSANSGTSSTRTSSRGR